ncbi:MAG: carboxypeptidase-like regulatory domain-containing protein [Terriglobales bacterium]
MKTIRYRWVFIVLALSALTTMSAASDNSVISGTVRDAAGVPQMGAVVEVLGVNTALKSVTDDHGQYHIANLLPGIYRVKVSALSFLPSLREGVTIKSGSNLIINLTLNTIFEAMQLAPVRARVPQDDDDWKWTLRSVANRPILRVLQGQPIVVVSEAEGKEERALKAKLAFIAGSEGQDFTSTDMGTSFMVERSLFGDGTVSFDGNVDASQGRTGMLRASYAHRMSDGSRPEVSFTMRRFATPIVTGDAPLSAMALRLSNSASFLGFLDMSYGGDLESVQFVGHTNAWRPFGTIDAHLSKQMTVEYRYATSRQPSRLDKQFDAAPADLSETGSRFSLLHGQPLLERARHHEVSVSRRFGSSGKTRIQAAAYDDRVLNLTPVGVGDPIGASNLVPDIYSNSFSYNAGDFHTRGLRFIAQQEFFPELTATMAYSNGGVLDIASGTNIANLSYNTVNRQAIAAKLSGRVPRTKTQWMASYKWTNGQALTPVDQFDASAGEAEPYLDIFIRQPIPQGRFIPAQMEALVDVRNLMAQGYVPVVGQDGQTIYLVQSARSIRGGVAFSF